MSAKEQFRETFTRFLTSSTTLSLRVASIGTVLNDHYCVCGQCGGDMALQAQKQTTSVTRCLVCTSCSLSLSLPMKGSLTALQKHCPICHYQLVQVTPAESDGDGYVVCPYCYNNPSSKNGIDIEDLGLGETLPCFKCNAVCSHASGSGCEG